MKPTPKPTAAMAARILKALPRTADGDKPIYPGMQLHCLHIVETEDGEKTWSVRECRAQAIGELRTILLSGAKNFWIWDSPSARNNCNFSTPAAALAEVKRRNGAKGK